MNRIALFIGVTAAAMLKAADAVPAATLIKPLAGEAAPAPDGFIRRWLLLDPMPATGVTDSAVQNLIRKDLFPDHLTVVPQAGDTVKAGDTEFTWRAVESKLYNVNLFHHARSLNKKTSDILVWAVAIVHAPKDMPNVRLSIGSNAASVWWVNGKEVIGIYGDRQTVIDDGVSKRLTLKKGVNIVRAAVVNGGGATDFCARFLDADDKPLRGITVSVGANTK